MAAVVMEAEAVVVEMEMVAMAVAAEAATTATMTAVEMTPASRRGTARSQKKGKRQCAEEGIVRARQRCVGYGTRVLWRTSELRAPLALGTARLAHLLGQRRRRQRFGGGAASNCSALPSDPPRRCDGDGTPE